MSFGQKLAGSFYSLLTKNIVITGGYKSARGAPRAFVNFACAEFHSCAVLLPPSPPTALGGSTFSLLLVFLDSLLSQRMTGGGS